MNDISIERPRVTKVKVTVKSNVQHSDCSEILFTLDRPGNSQNFPYTPAIIINSVQVYQAEGTPVFNNDGVHTVMFTSNSKVFDISLDVKRNGDKKPIELEYEFSTGSCG